MTLWLDCFALHQTHRVEGTELTVSKLPSATFMKQSTINGIHITSFSLGYVCLKGTKL